MGYLPHSKCVLARGRVEAQNAKVGSLFRGTESSPAETLVSPRASVGFSPLCFVPPPLRNQWWCNFPRQEPVVCSWTVSKSRPGSDSLEKSQAPAAAGLRQWVRALREILAQGYSAADCMKAVGCPSFVSGT